MKIRSNRCALAKASVNVDMIIQSEAREGANDISFTVGEGDVKKAMAALAPVKESLGAKALTVLRGMPGSYLADLSTTALLLGLAVVLALGWKQLRPRTRAFTIYCLILVFGTPLLFDVVGHWAFYYSYLRFVPAALALFAAVSDLAGAGPGGLVQKLRQPVWLATVGVAMAIGLPLRLALTLSCCHLASRAEVLETIRSKIGAGDVVLSDEAPFYETKKLAREVFCVTYSAALRQMPARGGHDFTPEEKRSISVLVIRPEQLAPVTNDLGGRWQPVSEPFGDTQDFSRFARWPMVGRRLASYALQPQTVRYQVQIFRRIGGTGRN